MTALEKSDPHQHERFLMAEVSVAGGDGVHQIRVRNLSAGGMMGEGAVAVDTGMRLTVDLPNLGTVEGAVAWVQGNRFGVAFTTDIDPSVVFGAGPTDFDDGDPDKGRVDRDRRSETRLS